MQLFKTKSSKDKEGIQKLVANLKTSFEFKIELSGFLFQQIKKNNWKKFNFYFTSEPHLYIIDDIVKNLF